METAKKLLVQCKEKAQQLNLTETDLVLDHAISWIQKSQLSSNQEEADTKVFLATQFSENVGCSDITIFTADSDIATLATCYVRKINFRLMFHSGVGSNVRILDMETSKWSHGVLESLPVLHAVSGCDFVSAVNGKGKARWLSTVQKKDVFFERICFKKLKNCFVFSMKCQMKHI